jgi:HEAT repeat protein
MTLADCRQALEDDNRVVRLRAARNLRQFGPAAGATLREALAHDDPAVRFLAATSLGQLGGETLQQAQAKLAGLVAAAQDGSDPPQPTSVRVAAAYALCEAGHVEPHLEVLVEALSYPERGMACYAADLIGRLGKAAESATGALEQVDQQNKPGVRGGDYHLGGAAANALRKIRGQ